MPFFYEAFRSLRANISNDDAGFMYASIAGDFKDFTRLFLDYVPGRNLHIAWNEVLFAVSGTSQSTFWIYHATQALTYAGVIFLIYKLQLQAGVRKNIALIFSLIALYCPAFSVILLWSTSLPQHLMSSVFLLIGIVYLLQIVNPESTLRTTKIHVSRFLIGLLFTLSMFTYDQAAAVVLFTTALIAFVYVFQKNFSVDLRGPGRILVSYLISISVFYLVVFFSGRGTGDNLTVGGGTLDRLAGNLLIPLRVLSKIQTHSASAKSYFFYNPSIVFVVLALGIILFSIFIGRILYVEWVRKVSRDSRKLFLGLIFLALSFAAYMPAAVWYVSPRHLYLPLILAIIGMSILFDFVYSRAKMPYWVNGMLILSALLSIVLVIVGFHAQISSWENRDQTRIQIYGDLEKDMSKLGVQCIIVDPDLNATDPFLYSEVPNYAIEYYAGRPVGKTKKCEFSPVLLNGNQYLCNEINRETWYLLSDYRRNTRSSDFVFELTQVCS